MVFNSNLDTTASRNTLSSTSTPIVKRVTRGAMALAASTLMISGMGIGAIATEPVSRSSAATSIKAAAKTLTGTFRSVEHPTSGSITVVKDGDKPYLTLGSDFKTDPGPALEIIFYSESSVPLNIEGKGQYFRLAKLRRVRGTDRYALPKNLDLSKYKSVAIWCQEFDATFGYAALK